MSKIKEANKTITENLNFARGLHRAWGRCYMILKIAPQLADEACNAAFTFDLQKLKAFYRKYENTLSLHTRKEEK